uniref:Uncharacterized protein n=1 Tax=Panagrolaimus sp. PS1159 TaxID=55785 RepID=A0AC35FIN8_9BILA
MNFKQWILLLFLINFVESRRKGSSRGEFNNKPGMSGYSDKNLLDNIDEENEDKDEISRNEVLDGGGGGRGSITTTTKATITTTQKVDEI